MVTSLFYRWDLDGNGYIDISELLNVYMELAPFQTKDAKRAIRKWLAYCRPLDSTGLWRVLERCCPLLNRKDNPPECW